MSKGLTIKKEEFTPLAEIVLNIFTRDFDKINARYAKLNNDFKNKYADKILAAQTQQKKLVLTEQQKATTQSLYDETAQLVEELIFVVDYFDDANIDSAIVKKIIHDLRVHNVEGATEKLETMRQVIVANQPVLVDEGMAADFPAKIADHIISLDDKNKQQKLISDSGEVVTGTNNINYEDLYKDTVNITQKARKVFKNTLFEEQYVISKIISSMRSGKKSSTINPDTPPVNP
jgi:hypothetical protein